MRTLFLLPLLAGCAASAPPGPASAPAARTATPRILAVFAHPDDESVVSPALANAARRGARVRIVYATRGDASAPETTLAPGPAIAARRTEEAVCASRALGAADPILYDFGDGKLGEIVRPPAGTLGRLRDSLAATLADERPDIVITWGPDGGYGHPDHRLVTAVVTQVVAGADRRPLLLYAAMERGSLPDQPQIAAMGWAETAPDLLTVRSRFTAGDLAAAARAFECHASQYDAASRAALPALFGSSVWKDGVHFRPALDPAAGEDLFDLARPAR
ncbi:PIG-L family deacetylase [Tsuneonella sp. YG55]|uniref:PIG-L family deacetylase n=1 Tax=Tsuneonella litorea TaxID=2976475 RepID=A0A9X2W2N2_9SPHN|nr:PIG-L family deacetylase [Tsuneonella litorea]MCT2559977.1 PIG-L family deacetylase [Tsuneonella litorea]